MSVVQLPMGDLFRPYEYDGEGNIKQRSDTMSQQEKNLQAAAGRGPDVAAILAAELAEAQAQLANKK